MTPIVYNPNDPETRTNPWPLYQRLRDEAPVALMTSGTDDGEDFYVLSRYEDTAMALRDNKRFSSHLRRGDFLDMPVMVNRDAPDHTKLRRITNRALGPRALAPKGEWLQKVVDEMVGELLLQPEVEFVDQFTSTLPLRVVGTMLGFPIERKADLLRWSRAVFEVFAVAGGTDPSEVPGYYEDFMGLVNFIDQLAGERVGCPHRGDIMSDLAVREEAGEVTRDEVVGLGWSLIVAGSETTMNLLGGGMEMLLRDQALAERLTADPDKTDDFMEEYLRLFSPQQWVIRRINEDVELHGVLMPADSIVHVLLGSANRDPRKFANPDVFDLDRENTDDNVAFGGGRHFCPGSALGRQFAGLAFRSLYPHLHRLALDPARPPRLRTGPGNYGIEHMGVLISQPEAATAGV
jgi:cytochrome P450